jgi:uncharacterized protein (TIGR00725 family)
MDRKPLIAVIGPGVKCPDPLKSIAEDLGEAIGNAGYNLISGGRFMGVMNAVSKGAKEKGSMVIGILPGMDNSDSSEWLDISILTGAGSARNNFIVLSSDVVIALGKGPGTFSEIALAIKAEKPLILYNPEDNLYDLALQMGDQIYKAGSVEDVMAITGDLISKN